MCKLYSILYFRVKISRKTAFYDRDKLLSRAFRYASGEFAGELETLRNTVFATLQSALDHFREEEAADKQRIIAEYAAYLDKAEETVAQMQQQALQRKKAEEQRRAEEEKRRELERQEQERQEMLAQQLAAKQAAKRKKILIALAAAAAYVTVVSLVVTKVVSPSQHYQKRRNC